MRGLLSAYQSQTLAFLLAVRQKLLAPLFILVLFLACDEHIVDVDHEDEA